MHKKFITLNLNIEKIFYAQLIYYYFGHSMQIRKTTMNDIEPVMTIIFQAQQQFKKLGTGQWQNDYPNKETIAIDISRGESYVMVNKGEIVATIAIQIGYDDEYDMNHWRWPSSRYLIIHRLAVAESMKGYGLATQLMHFAQALGCKQGVSDFKVDTYQGNHAMQRLLLKLGFIDCGTMTLPNEHRRVMFQKLLI